MKGLGAWEELEWEELDVKFSAEELSRILLDVVFKDSRIMRCVSCNDIYLDHITEDTADWDTMFSPCCGTEDRYRLDASEIREERLIAGLHTVVELKATLSGEGKIATQFPTTTQEALWKSTNTT